MLHHPLILGPKLVVLAVIIVTLIVLHGILPPDQFKVAVLISIVVFILFTIVLWAIVLKTLGNPESKMAKQMVLSHQAPSGDGFSVSSDQFTALEGARGIAVSALRPSGTVEVDGKRVSVVTDGQFLPAGSQVEIVAVNGARIEVRQIAEP